MVGPVCGFVCVGNVRTIRARGRCGLLSNYFDHLLRFHARPRPPPGHAAVPSSPWMLATLSLWFDLLEVCRSHSIDYCGHWSRWPSLLITLFVRACHIFQFGPRALLLARLMGQYCYAGCRLSSSVVVCNVAGGRAGRPPGTWTVGAPAAGRVGGRAANTARRASRVTSR